MCLNKNLLFQLSKQIDECNTKVKAVIKPPAILKQLSNENLTIFEYGKARSQDLTKFTYSYNIEKRTYHKVNSVLNFLTCYIYVIFIYVCVC